MGNLHKTALNDRHLKRGANMVEFAGWEMPLHYEPGIVQEHLITRQDAGLFDISHMGRFTVRSDEYAYATFVRMYRPHSSGLRHDSLCRPTIGKQYAYPTF